MKVIDVLDLVTQYIGKLIVRLHPLNETRADEDVPSRQRKGIDEIAVRDVVKSIGKFSLREWRNASANLLHIRFDREVIRAHFFARGECLLRERVSGVDLIGIGNPSEFCRHAAQLTLGISDHGEDSLPAGSCLDRPPLCDDQCRTKKRKTGDVVPAMSHKNCRMRSRLCV